MHACESVKQTHESLVVSGIDPFLRDIPNLMPDANGVSQASFGYLFAVKQYVETLTARKLSYQSDALNACLGILHSFSLDTSVGYAP